jgi:uncharacterized protein YigA (DUF484 family)
MTKQEMTDKLADLEKLTRSMDVPSEKRRNVYWLRKHLAIRNEKHKNYQQAISLITELANQGISGA